MAQLVVVLVLGILLCSRIRIAFGLPADEEDKFDPELDAELDPSAFEDDLYDDDDAGLSAYSAESDSDDLWHKCGSDLSNPTGLRRFVDFPFIRKFVRNLSPFSRPLTRMSFYLFKREFPECGQEIRIDDNSLLESGFNASHQTRIIIHGWMSQGKGSFNRDVKSAYLSRGDFNVIIVDWSMVSTNLNYFSVVRMIEGFGEQVATFALHLNEVMGVQFDDIYLVGHSLGAQIAGSAGKRIKPHQFNTIFALDPAGPKFRRKSVEFRIDPTDAKYVESIQTSINLGFLEPTGNATFYPNYGFYQKCHYLGCSHVRSHQFFAESITSSAGFWGTRCEGLGLRTPRSHRDQKVDCEESTGEQFRMGGEPSLPKSGIFYVKTNASPPYAIGKS